MSDLKQLPANSEQLLAVIHQNRNNAYILHANKDDRAQSPGGNALPNLHYWPKDAEEAAFPLTSRNSTARYLLFLNSDNLIVAASTLHLHMDGEFYYGADNDRKAVQLAGVSVHQDYRGQGLGKKCIEDAFQRAAKLGVILDVGTFHSDTRDYMVRTIHDVHTTGQFNDGDQIKKLSDVPVYYQCYGNVVKGDSGYSIKWKPQTECDWLDKPAKPMVMAPAPANLTNLVPA